MRGHLYWKICSYLSGLCVKEMQCSLTGANQDLLFIWAQNQTGRCRGEGRHKLPVMKHTRPSSHIKLKHSIKMVLGRLLHSSSYNPTYILLTWALEVSPHSHCSATQLLGLHLFPSGLVPRCEQRSQEARWGLAECKEPARMRAGRSGTAGNSSTPAVLDDPRSRHLRTQRSFCMKKEFNTDERKMWVMCF